MRSSEEARLSRCAWFVLSEASGRTDKGEREIGEGKIKEEKRKKKKIRDNDIMDILPFLSSMR